MRLVEKLKRIDRYHNRLILFWFPWFWHRHSVGELRRKVSALEWSKAGTVRRKSYLFISALLWPLIALVPLTLVWGRHSCPSAGINHRSRFRQLVDLFLFTYWYGHAPIEYYERMLYCEILSDAMKSFVAQHECKVIATALNGDKAEIIKNKFKFVDYCKKNSLPVAPILFNLEKGYPSLEPAESPLPPVDVYIKPEEGQKGIGIERWNYLKDENVWSFHGRKLDLNQFFEYFRELASSGEYLVQKALRNHDSLKGFSLGGLVTFRVITVSDGYSGPEVIGTYIAFPRGHSTTNHEIYGGMVAEMDFASGHIFAAFSDTPFIEKHSVHPDTMNRIEGHIFSACKQLLEVAIDSHTHFPDVFSIGWDIAYTPQGFFILEGNTFWGLHPGLLLGRTSYVQKALKQLRKNIS